MRVVVALGGNALVRRDEPLDAAVQRANVRRAATGIAAIAREHTVVVSHGNGPQVGLLALQNEAYRAVLPYPLDLLDAETEGMVGYLLEQELGRHLPEDRLATLLTQIEVDADDPAFEAPTKFVGPHYSEHDALHLARDHDWTVARDGDTWRRVVPSPEPRAIIELATIRLLVEHGITVICAGGGGIPVVRDPAGGLRGVEAVIDKDLAASLLARAVHADVLLLLTDVDGVHDGWGTASSRLVRDISAAELRRLPLPAGSMGPKALACARFVEAGGRAAAIGSLDEAPAVLRGEAGTQVHR